MKAILYFENKNKVVADIINPPKRKQREAHREYEEMICNAMKSSGIKIINVHLTRV